MPSLFHRFVCLSVALLIPSTILAQEDNPGIPLQVHEASIEELQEALSSGRVTSVQLVDAYLARIRAFDQSGPSLNAILSLNLQARHEAMELDRERTEWGPRSPLHGIPVLLKDNIDVAMMPTTAASFALAGAIPADDAHIVQRLRVAGAIILGKTNLNELGLGITTLSSLDGQTLNPYDTSRNPGGSSGGTGAAVAASFAAVGYGTDTCGSLRIPAAFNALFSLRSTKGLISLDGVMPVSRSEDVVGPVARTVSDLAIALDGVAGFDPNDPTTRAARNHHPQNFSEALRRDALQGVRIGVLEDYLEPHLPAGEVVDLLVPLARSGKGGGPDAELLESVQERTADLETRAAVVRAALENMVRLGAELVPIRIPELDSMLPQSSTVAHEFRFDLEDYLREIPSAPVQSLSDILERGLYHPSLEATLKDRVQPGKRDTEAYRAALAGRKAIRDTILMYLEREGLDAIAYPTMRQGPALIRHPQRGSTCQISAASGLPALALPAGFTPDGLPVGLELLGRPFSDARLVGFAYAYEQSVHPRQPPDTTPAILP